MWRGILVTSFLLLALCPQKSFSQLAPGSLVQKKTPVSLSYRTTSLNSTAQTAYTFSGLDIGVNPGLNRRVVVGVFGRFALATTRTIDSLTIDGVSAFVDVGQYNIRGTDHLFVMALASAIVPTHTSGDVVVTFNGAMIDCRVVIYEVRDSIIGNTYTASDGTSGAVSSVSISVNNVETTDAILALGMKGNHSNAGTFTVVSNDTAQNMGPDQTVYAATKTSPTAGANSVTFSTGQNAARHYIVGVLLK